MAIIMLTYGFINFGVGAAILLSGSIRGRVQSCELPIRGSK